ncbi:CdaR family protein [Streptococcus plurextorum]|uniref:CdaR family protein n=1 Tax=Streptococcus plurextorum TaxID=456876 RepID=UPI0003FA227F|nr:CdaR family protein [Streptococcus plurextorum]
MRNRLFNKRTGLILVSFLFAMLLFLTATVSSYNSTQQQIMQTAETYSHTLENIPIDIKYDSDKYFISGYSYETEVYLTSTNRLKLDTEINSSTRHFKVVADLSQLSEGTHKVTLEVKELPDEVTATVTPEIMTVTIGKKTAETFPVKIDLEESLFAAGYELDSYELTDKLVEVTSDETTIGQIDHVKAVLPDGLSLSSDYNDKVTLQAVAADGRILPAVIEPAKTTLKVKVHSLTKTVPIKVVYTGTMDSSVSEINNTLSQSSALIQGKKEALDQVKEIVVTMDITSVTESVILRQPLKADRVLVLPDVVDVTLNVVKKK